MDVDANIVIDKLCNQIGQMAKALSVRDAQIELLQKEIAVLKTALDLQKEMDAQIELLQGEIAKLNAKE